MSAVPVKVNNKSVFKRALETLGIFGAPKEDLEIKRNYTAVLGVVEQNYGIYQIPSFRDLVTMLWGDPLLVEACMMFAQQVVATGFFLTGNPDSDADDKKIGGKTALEVITEWCELNHIDIKIFEIALELRAFGNSFWRLDPEMGFVKIPIESVWHMVRIDPKIPLQEKYHVQLTPIYGGVIIDYKKYIHFRSFVTGYHAPFGMGMLQPMLTKPLSSDAVVAPSLYDIRLNLRTSLYEGIKKFSIGNELWCFPEMSNEDFEKQGLAENIAKMSTTGNRIATNTNGKIEIAVPSRTQSYDSFVAEMRNEFHMGMADPSLKLGLEEGYTKATSNDAVDAYEFKISTMRKTIKQHFEDLFIQILEKEGYDGKLAKIQMNFGPEEKASYNIADIVSAVSNKIISRKSATKLLITYQKWDVNVAENEAELAEELEKETKLAQDNMAQQAKAKGLSNEVGALPEKDKKEKKIKKTEAELLQEAIYSPFTYKEPQVVMKDCKDRLSYMESEGIVFIDTTVKDDDLKELLTAYECYKFPLVAKLGMGSERASKLALIHMRALSDKKGLEWEKVSENYTKLLATKRGK
jgi:hypothetical protein